MGVERARALATVLPDDAANVFITLSARSLNPGLQIIARGEAPSTETKLIQAGANKVVLPTHIGAERIAELVLFPDTARLIRSSERMREVEKTLRDLGIDMEVVIAGEETALPGLTVAEVEARVGSAGLIAQVHRREGETITHPPGELVIETGDGLVMVGRAVALNALRAPAARARAGRTLF